jgi:hypothetical protein
MCYWPMAFRSSHAATLYFTTAVGTHFRLIGKPQIGWSGVIECEVLEAREPSVLRYSWVADGGDELQLTYRLEPHNGGTRFTFDQTGFKGIGGFLLAKLVMTPIRKKMFCERIPNLLNEFDNDLGSTLNPNERSRSGCSRAPSITSRSQVLNCPHSTGDSCG